jgi:hypothetical protein
VAGRDGPGAIVKGYEGECDCALYEVGGWGSRDEGREEGDGGEDWEKHGCCVCELGQGDVRTGPLTGSSKVKEKMLNLKSGCDCRLQE